MPSDLLADLEVVVIVLNDGLMERRLLLLQILVVEVEAAGSLENADTEVINSEWMKREIYVFMMAMVMDPFDMSFIYRYQQHW